MHTTKVTFNNLFSSLFNALFKTVTTFAAVLVLFFQVTSLAETYSVSEKAELENQKSKVTASMINEANNILIYPPNTVIRLLDQKLQKYIDFCAAKVTEDTEADYVSKCSSAFGEGVIKMYSRIVKTVKTYQENKSEDNAYYVIRNYANYKQIFNAQLAFLDVYYLSNGK